MKKRRSKQQWLELIQEQKNSGLSIAEFCRREGLQDKYFYKRKSDLENTSLTRSHSPFIQLESNTKQSEAKTTIRVKEVVIETSSSDFSSDFLKQFLVS